MTTLEVRQALRGLISGFISTRMLHLAVELGLADLLAEGSRTADDLARETATHAPSLARLLRGLTALGVFVEETTGRFGPTPVSELLRRDRPDSLRAIALDFGAPHIQAAWMALPHGVRTGESSFRQVHGMDYWEYLRRHPDIASNFNDMLQKARPHQCAAVARAYDFSSVATLVDVGGGHGQFLAAILDANPEMRGVLFDAPTVVPGAAQALRIAGLDDRCRVEGGDFFASIPDGGDAYILEHVIHDWSDADSVRILATCRRAMRAGAKLLLVEQLLSPAATPIDMHMLVLFGEARQRTEAEFRDLLDAAGFRLIRVVPTESEASIVEGVVR